MSDLQMCNFCFSAVPTRCTVESLTCPHRIAAENAPRIPPPRVPMSEREDDAIRAAWLRDGHYYAADYDEAVACARRMMETYRNLDGIPIPRRHLLALCAGRAAAIEEAAKAEAECARLRDALTALLRQTNNIEVLGEWSALDINYSSQKQYRAKVDEVIAAARAAIDRAREGKP